MTASIDGIEVSDGNLRMTNPKLEGADKKNGKYRIGAEYADQDMKAPNQIKLHAMNAELTTADGGWSRMNAVRGLFNNRTEKLRDEGQDHRRHELGHHRRAQARVARDEEPDASIASAGLVHAESRQRQGERADLQLRRQHADLPRQGSRASGQASEGRQRGEEAAEGRGRSPDCGSTAAGSDRRRLREHGRRAGWAANEQQASPRNFDSDGGARARRRARRLPRRP